MTYEGVRLKLNAYYRKLFAKQRKKRLVNTDFTVISNNCWGGMLYESYDLPKSSPTVGMFFMAEDYIKFCSDLKGYTSKEIKFIPPEESRHINEIGKYKRFGTYPIGIIDDVEIMFLHFHSEQEAKEKWQRRCQRINWYKLIIKFNDQNGCNEEHVKAFFDLPFEHKLFFTIHDWSVIKKGNGYYRIRQHTHDNCITASHEPYGRNRYVDLTGLINRL